MSEVRDLDLRLVVRLHVLNQSSLRPREGRAPDLVPTDDLPEAGDECVRIELPIATNGEGLGVEGDVRRELAVQPDLLLSEGDRRDLARRPARDGVPSLRRGCRRHDQRASFAA